MCFFFIDFAIWSKVELSNFDFHINFTDPATEEFKRVKNLLENEVSKITSLIDILFDIFNDPTNNFLRPCEYLLLTS